MRPPPGWKFHYYARFDFEGEYDDGPHLDYDDAVRAGIESSFEAFSIVTLYRKYAEGEGFVLDSTGERIYPGTRMNHVLGPGYDYFWAVSVDVENQTVITDPSWNRQPIPAAHFIVKNPKGT